MYEPPEVQYFLRSRPAQAPLLLRRTRTPAGGLVDEAFLAGRWQPTPIIVDYMFGHDDDVEPIPGPSS